MARIKQHLILVLVSKILLASISCKPALQGEKSKIETALENLRPYDEKRIPDSMKIWLAKFREVYILDQKYRQSSEIFLRNQKSQNRIDSINQEIVMEYVSKYGYPQLNLVGGTGTLAVQTVMTHASIHQKKAFYPYLIKAYKSGNATGLELSTFEDKFNVQLKRRQYYGTQLMVNSENKYMLAPVYNVDSLDYFRNEIKLGSIATYLKEFGVEWSIEEYKKHNELSEKKLKITDLPPLRFVVSEHDGKLP